MSKRPLIIAHRGASAEAPENTLMAFLLAFMQGADAVEADVRMTIDGHLVVVCGLSDSTVSVNDPGVRLSRVRREFPRAAFRNAWAASHQTVYVVWPEGRVLPVSPSGTW